MIFVTVGTQFPFDRLIATVDAWAGRNGIENVVAQTGYGEYQPKSMNAQPFISPDRFQEYQNEARLLISHAGMGAILSALESAKPLIIMPRQAAQGEHRNDHQLATAARFRGTPGIYVADGVQQLDNLLEKSVELSASGQIASSASTELIQALSEFLNVDRPMAGSRK